MWAKLILSLCLVGCVPKWIQKYITIKYNNSLLSTKGIRHDGYYRTATPFQKAVERTDTAYTLFFLYKDNTYLNFVYRDSSLDLRTILEVYWGIYNVTNDTLRIQFTSDNRDNYLAPWIAGEDIYVIHDDILKYVKRTSITRKGKFAFPEHGVEFYTTFIPSSYIPPPNSWLKKETWMYEPITNYR